MKKLRFALFGTGFWSRFQLGGWQQTGKTECVALYNRTRSKAEAVAREWNVPAVYDDPQALLDNEKLDFVDICTNVETHAPLTLMALERGLPVVCQKPMATSLAEAEQMVAASQRLGVPLYINENWRWQYPLRQLKAHLDSGRIGRVFRARIDYRNSFPVFDNQPFLKELEQFILTDIGSHILDTARYLFGEAVSLLCHTHRIHQDIKGEDVATVMFKMQSGATVVCDMSYASRTERERFPQTYVEIEGSEGFLELAQDYWVRETTAQGTFCKRYVPPRFSWADPAYDLVHSSIHPCQDNLADALLGHAQAETSAEDNLKTVQLMYGSYASAATGQVVALPFTSQDYARLCSGTSATG
ncbi:MAG: Gfo/Idh/MocA family oxidoreductase [Anaerolineae bacterium]|nr:Gfo/Idh/MocA family oxidoreductase [Anaerolineae bacterium]MDW8172693.1 Gfo/Idh/MocA family oxidoreductase [Anaerolineae bacterium]